MDNPQAAVPLEPGEHRKPRGDEHNNSGQTMDKPCVIPGPFHDIPVKDEMQDMADEAEEQNDRIKDKKVKKYPIQTRLGYKNSHYKTDVEIKKDREYKTEILTRLQGIEREVRDW